MRTLYSFILLTVVLIAAQSQAVAAGNKTILSATQYTVAKSAMQWGDITATRHGSSVLVIFTCYNRNNVDHFQLQRSTDGIQWETVSAMQQPAGADQHFELQDATAPEEGVHYRVLSADTEGTTSFSKIIVVASAANTL